MNRDKELTAAVSESWIAEELEQANRQGIPASINGVLYDGKRGVPPPLMFEQGSYMEDFVNDESGNIIQINFDRVRHLN